jgi:hypothetical protein
MRYFTALMWQGVQQRSGEQLDETYRKWDLALQEYRQQLAALRSRLDDEAFVFFDEADVHDGELLELRIMDGSRPAPLTSPARPWETSMNYPVRVELAVLDAKEEFLWRLSYTGLRRVIVDFPGEQTLFYRTGEGFGDWGCHELTDAGNSFLRHEVLFASGSILTVEFKGVAVAKTPYRQTPLSA